MALTSGLVDVQLIQLQGGATESDDAQEELLVLRAQVKQLKRENYLLNLRKDNCPVGGLLGSWSDEGHPNAAQNWHTCYPAATKAQFCMSGYRDDTEVKPNDLCSRQEAVKWQPPSSAHQRQLRERSEYDNDGHFDIVEMGPPFDPRQLPKGLFQVMKMDASKGVALWDWATLQHLAEMLDSGKDVSPMGYPEAMKDMHAALQRVGGLQDKTALVVGSISPWLEAIALYAGAKQVTTSDYALPVFSRDLAEHEPRLRRGQKLPEMLADANSEQYDVLLSYSSIEHDGLGRYGDPIMPNGDLAAMSEAFLLLKPGGTFVLGVPSEVTDALYYYSERRYGPVRFPVLTRGWNYGGSISNGTFNESFKLGRFHGSGYTKIGIHSVVILRKPMDAHETLEDMYDEEGCTMTCVADEEDSSCGPSAACSF